MKLLTKELEAKLPKLYSQENNDNPKIIVKFFCPWNNWKWYVLEGEKKDDDYLFFGFVQGDFPELGYFSLKELSEIKGMLGLGIERDMYFGEHYLKEIRGY